MRPPLYGYWPGPEEDGVGRECRFFDFWPPDCADAPLVSDVLPEPELASVPELAEPEPVELDVVDPPEASVLPLCPVPEPEPVLEPALGCAPWPCAPWPVWSVDPACPDPDDPAWPEAALSPPPLFGFALVFPLQPSMKALASNKVMAILFMVEKLLFGYQMRKKSFNRVAAGGRRFMALVQQSALSSQHSGITKQPQIFADERRSGKQPQNFGNEHDR